MLLIIFSVVPSIVFADARQFIPKITGYSGFLEADSTYDSDENSISGRNSTQKSDLFLRQILDLSAAGYVYHPRFISFSLRLALGVKEEDFSDGATNRFSKGFANEYEFRAMVLPEHPYNLEVFHFKLEPLAKGGFLSESSQTVAYSTGAIFRYKKKPYFLSVHYLENSGESSKANHSTTKYGFLATYYKELKGGKTYSFSASYDRQTSDSSNSVGSSNEASLSNTFAFKTARLSSSLIYHDSVQDSSLHSLSVSGRGVSWAERGQVYLPWNFSADLSYGLSKESVETGGPLFADSKVTDTTNAVAFSLTHKLYESLMSTLSLGYSSLNSESGRSNSLSHGLAFAYSKKIPGGMLRAGVSFGSSDMNTEGVRSIANETHSSIQVPGRFTLNNDDVNVGTIIVWLKSTIVSGELVLLQQNIDYVITPFGNSVQVEILNLPAEFSIPGMYDFVVSYSLNRQDSKFRTETLNYSVTLDLFRGMFSPYYNHTETKQTLLGGATDFEPVQMSTDAFGFLITWRPLTFNAAYQVIDSNINPSRGWKAEVNYNDNIFLNTQIQAAARLSSTFYPNGASQTSGESYTEKLWALSLGVQQRIPKRNMFLYLGGSYTQEQGLGQTTTYSLNSSFVWKIGKIFITAGGSASLSDASVQGLKNKRRTQNYYLTVKRKLF